jgi:hypothetical protein
MDYKDEMRKLIDIVKQQSLNAPLAQTLDDMNILTNAVSDLSKRLSLRVRKITQPKANQAKRKAVLAVKFLLLFLYYLFQNPICQVNVNPFQAIIQKVFQQSKVR